MGSTIASQNLAIDRFCRQYLQLELELDYPAEGLLCHEAFQEALYERLFARDAVALPPPQRYRLRVLKQLVAKIEAAIVDWDEHGISDNLMAALAHLVSMPLPSEETAVQQKCYVTYRASLVESSSTESEANITLLESRSLISAAGTTGLRTWEASLHLGQYLCTHPSLTRGRRILELGTGTGYIAMLCARHLGAQHVLASDGSEDVVNNLPDNLFLNGLQGSNKVTPTELKWGHALVGSEEKGWNGGQRVDVVLGADLTYDASGIPALVATLEELVSLFPDVEIVIAATERNTATLQGFLTTCGKRGFAVNHEPFPVPPRNEQNGPFYNDKMPVHICKLYHIGMKR
ncbi:putative methyltransferase-domain-containing protein [Lasiosphaeria miniovina]|uniref:Methyltransferase-domain-containing protein n=1 Tax=Lasiosphaeria miniovina TaxID=1954250 RepID=A0AA40DY83_9PEZI|nr:putative methyltransferase-domain-containing protein [Lasiosphaeria miniovina]KAK0717396.1 putative methyltransferase-domain-containing protein [Lasiosphaeria miniovina]